MKGEAMATSDCEGYSVSRRRHTSRRRCGASINGKPCTPAQAAAYLAQTTGAGAPIIKRRRNADGRATLRIDPAPRRQAADAPRYRHRAPLGRSRRLARNGRCRGSRRSNAHASRAGLAGGDPDPDDDSHLTRPGWAFRPAPVPGLRRGASRLIERRQFPNRRVRRLSYGAGDASRQQKAPLRAGFSCKKRSPEMTNPPIPSAPNAPDPVGEDAWEPTEYPATIAGTVNERRTFKRKRDGEPFEVLTIRTAEGEEIRVLCGRAHLAQLVRDNDPQPGDGIAITAFGREDDGQRYLYGMRTDKSARLSGGDEDVGGFTPSRTPEGPSGPPESAPADKDAGLFGGDS